jgi:hypothetical protein
MKRAATRFPTTTEDYPMKRDMDLVNAILNVIESQPRAAWSPVSIAKTIAPDDEEKYSLVLNHLRIMQDVGYIATVTGGDVRLTWAGHDCVEGIKKPMKINPSAVETFAKLGER